MELLQIVKYLGREYYKLELNSKLEESPHVIKSISIPSEDKKLLPLRLTIVSNN
ncbi:12038_t:CDS:2 [Funneliformis geosporum]|uniref:12038_t:CDS:1 n=1 Tax=Funneliformis geosporum TaxID=1117311 RepID=A0A9W4SW52_9GLOM|nr:12038_t:CDS:2 [Funneliformis geosporum]